MISYLFDDWSYINKEKAINFILSLQRYDGALSMTPNAEGHGGATFVGVASLYLMGALPKLNTQKLLRWCIINQGHGFTGRPCKPQDSCYSYWIGATIDMLKCYYYLYIIICVLFQCFFFCFFHFLLYCLCVWCVCGSVLSFLPLSQTFDAAYFFF